MPSQQPSPTVVQKDDAKAVPAEILAQSIVKIDESIKAMLGAGLKRAAIVALIYDHSKVAKRDINAVIDSMDALRRTYTTR